MGKADNAPLSNELGIPVKIPRPHVQINSTPSSVFGCNPLVWHWGRHNTTSLLAGQALNAGLTLTTLCSNPSCFYTYPRRTLRIRSIYLPLHLINSTCLPQSLSLWSCPFHTARVLYCSYCEQFRAIESCSRGRCLMALLSPPPTPPVFSLFYEYRPAPLWRQNSFCLLSRAKKEEPKLKPGLGMKGASWRHAFSHVWCGVCFFNIHFSSKAWLEEGARIYTWQDYLRPSRVITGPLRLGEQLAASGAGGGHPQFLLLLLLLHALMMAPHHSPTTPLPPPG